MFSRRILLLTIAQALSAFLIAREAEAQWQLNGGVICNSVSSQELPTATSDGRGGYIVTWQDARAGTFDIYAQRLNSRGVAQWSEGGVPVCTALLDQRSPTLISDGQGGAIVTWEDYRTSASTQSDIYAQRIDSLGVGLWSPDGVTICTASGSQTTPTPVRDGAAGAVIIWSDARTGTNNLFVQRVDHDGVRLWTSNGIGVAPIGAFQTGPAAVSDAAGGMFVVWTDYRGPSPADLYAQHIASDGSRGWGSTGTIVSIASGSQSGPRLVTDGSGGIVTAWNDSRTGTADDVYAQKIIASGLPAWTDNGVAMCSAPGYQSIGCLASDGAGGAIATWADQRAPGPADLFAQRVNALGVPQWTPDGIVVCNAPGSQSEAKCVGDGSSGIVIVWNDQRFGSIDAFAQRLLASGATQWAHNGVQLTKAQQTSSFSISDDSSGGAAIFWHQTRFTDSDIYGQRVLSTGEPGYRLNLYASLSSVRDVPGDQGGWLRIGLTGAEGDAGQLEPLVSGYNLWRRIASGSSLINDASPIVSEERPEAGLGVALDLRARVLRESEAASAGFPPGNWESLGFHAATQSATYTLLAPTKHDSTEAGAASEVFLVSVHTTDPTIYTVSAPDSGYSVDNIPPDEPQNVSGAGTPSGSIQITWDSNGEGDFSHYVVYKGEAADFDPSPAGLLGSTTSPQWTDSAFDAERSFYKIGSVDVHGNVSLYALLTPNHVLEIQGGKHLMTTRLFRIQPNPFTSKLTLRLEVARAMHVDLRVYDVGGRIVRHLIDASLPVGRQDVDWDGRDDHGAAVDPGVFFIRFSTPALTQLQRVLRMQ